MPKLHGNVGLRSRAVLVAAAIALAGAAVAQDEGKERPMSAAEIKDKVGALKKRIADSLSKMQTYADKAGDDDEDGCEASQLALGRTLETSSKEVAADLGKALEAGDLALAKLKLKQLEQAAENADQLEDASEICAMGGGVASGDLDRDVSGQTGSEDEDLKPKQDNPLDFGYDPDDRVVSPF